MILYLHRELCHRHHHLRSHTSPEPIPMCHRHRLFVHQHSHWFYSHLKPSVTNQSHTGHSSSLALHNHSHRTNPVWPSMLIWLASSRRKKLFLSLCTLEGEYDCGLTLRFFMLLTAVDGASYVMSVLTCSFLLPLTTRDGWRLSWLLFILSQAMSCLGSLYIA